MRPRRLVATGPSGAGSLAGAHRLFARSRSDLRTARPLARSSSTVLAARGGDHTLSSPHNESKRIGHEGQSPSVAYPGSIGAKRADRNPDSAAAPTIAAVSARNTVGPRSTVTRPAPRSSSDQPPSGPTR